MAENNVLVTNEHRRLGRKQASRNVSLYSHWKMNWPAPLKPNRPVSYETKANTRVTQNNKRFYRYSNRLLPTHRVILKIHA